MNLTFKYTDGRSEVITGVIKLSLADVEVPGLTPQDPPTFVRSLVVGRQNGQILIRSVSDVSRFFMEMP